MAKALRNKVASRDEWIKARKALLVKEKKHTREREKLAAARRSLPWEPVADDYVFDGPNGKQTLAELFDGRSQLVVYHFMFDPDWDAGCPHCSWWADSFDHPMQHLNHHDVTMVAISRAPYEKLAAYRKRMGWSFKWFSSLGNRFNYDFNVTFTPTEVKAKKAFYNFKTQDPFAPEREGLSVFYKDAKGRMYRTYSAFARGIDPINIDYQLIDLTPKGRDEGGRGNQYWIRRHDEYAK
jgi:predicted dithiol-disulfide oxidoreductase (DUF899 family)